MRDREVGIQAIFSFLLLTESLYKAEVCCVATSKLVFLDAKDLVLSLLLIYTFR